MRDILRASLNGLFRDSGAGFATEGRLVIISSSFLQYPQTAGRMIHQAGPRFKPGANS
jgi:hypothetical protein